MKAAFSIKTFTSYSGPSDVDLNLEQIQGKSLSCNLHASHQPLVPRLTASPLREEALKNISTLPSPGKALPPLFPPFHTSSVDLPSKFKFPMFVPRCFPSTWVNLFKVSIPIKAGQTIQSSQVHPYAAEKTVIKLEAKKTPGIFHCPECTKRSDSKKSLHLLFEHEQEVLLSWRKQGHRELHHAYK